MSYIMADLHTAETFPIADYTIGKVLEMIAGEIEGFLDESIHKWTPGMAESLAELLALRDALFELVQAEDNPLTGLAKIDEGVLQKFEKTHNVDEYLAGLGEQQLRAFIWDDLSERCATCREFSDYCQGHGVIG